MGVRTAGEWLPDAYFLDAEGCESRCSQAEPGSMYVPRRPSQHHAFSTIPIGCPCSSRSLASCLSSSSGVLVRS